MRQHRLQQNVALIAQREEAEAAQAVAAPPELTPRSLNSPGPSPRGINNSPEQQPNAEADPFPLQEPRSQSAGRDDQSREPTSSLPQREADRHKYEPEAWAPKARSRG
jgi:hypothetical protein